MKLIQKSLIPGFIALSELGLFVEFFPDFVLFTIKHVNKSYLISAIKCTIILNLEKVVALKTSLFYLSIVYLHHYN